MSIGLLDIINQIKNIVLNKRPLKNLYILNLKTILSEFKNSLRIFSVRANVFRSTKHSFYRVVIRQLKCFKRFALKMSLNSREINHN